MCDKKRDYLCKTHSALFVRLFSLGCESSHSRGHDNELVHPLELKLSWKGKLARRRFNFVCALSFMRFTGLLDRTLSNRGTKRTFGAMLQTEGGRGRASKWPFQSVGAKQLTRKPQIQVGTSRIEMPQGSREKLETNKLIAPEKLVLISLGGGGFCKFNPGRPSLKFGFGCWGLL